ncbi:MAG: hypothetical protein EZS28_030519, partial [Streblomastix strix]
MENDQQLGSYLNAKNRQAEIRRLLHQKKTLYRKWRGDVYLNVDIGSAHDKNKKFMEDDYVASKLFGQHPISSIAGVFDGHSMDNKSGKKAAQILRNNLIATVLGKYDQELREARLFDVDFTKLLQYSFQRMEDMMKETSADQFEMAGCTATLVLVHGTPLTTHNRFGEPCINVSTLRLFGLAPQPGSQNLSEKDGTPKTINSSIPQIKKVSSNGQRELFCANVGDSEAFLFSSDPTIEPVMLTFAHKSTVESERQRCRDAGADVAEDDGSIYANRVNGMQVTRSIGDFFSSCTIPDPHIIRVTITPETLCGDNFFEDAKKKAIARKKLRRIRKIRRLRRIRTIQQRKQQMKKVGSKADNEATEEQNNPEYYSYPEDDLNDYDDNDFDDESDEQLDAELESIGATLSPIDANDETNDSNEYFAIPPPTWVVMASDGLWDVMSARVAHRLISEYVGVQIYEDSNIDNQQSKTVETTPQSSSQQLIQVLHTGPEGTPSSSNTSQSLSFPPSSSSYVSSITSPDSSTLSQLSSSKAHITFPHKYPNAQEVASFLLNEVLDRYNNPQNYSEPRNACMYSSQLASLYASSSASCMSSLSTYSAIEIADKNSRQVKKIARDNVAIVVKRLEWLPLMADGDDERPTSTAKTTNRSELESIASIEPLSGDGSGRIKRGLRGIDRLTLDQEAVASISSLQNQIKNAIANQPDNSVQTESTTNGDAINDFGQFNTLPRAQFRRSSKLNVNQSPDGLDFNEGNVEDKSQDQNQQTHKEDLSKTLPISTSPNQIQIPQSITKAVSPAPKSNGLPYSNISPGQPSLMQTPSHMHKDKPNTANSSNVNLISPNRDNNDLAGLVVGGTSSVLQAKKK